MIPKIIHYVWVGPKAIPDEDLVAYRMHGQNAFAGNRTTGDPEIFFMRQIILGRLFCALRSRFALQQDVVKLAHLEFKTIPNPSFKDLWEYLLYILKNGANGAGRLRGILMTIKWYLLSMVHKQVQSGRRTRSATVLDG